MYVYIYIYICITYTTMLFYTILSSTILIPQPRLLTVG